MLQISLVVKLHLHVKDEARSIMLDRKICKDVEFRQSSIDQMLVAEEIWRLNCYFNKRYQRRKSVSLRNCSFETQAYEYALSSLVHPAGHFSKKGNQLSCRRHEILILECEK